MGRGLLAVSFWRFQLFVTLIEFKLTSWLAGFVSSP